MLWFNRESVEGLSKRKLEVGTREGDLDGCDVKGFDGEIVGRFFNLTFVGGTESYLEGDNVGYIVGGVVTGNAVGVWVVSVNVGKAVGDKVGGPPPGRKTPSIPWVTPLYARIFGVTTGILLIATPSVPNGTIFQR